MSGFDAEVIIVGGGPAGSSTGYFLAQMGVDVTILDRARFPRDKVCSEYLSPEASRILSTMGVLGQIQAAPTAKLTGMMVRTPRGHELRGHFASDHGFRGYSDHGIAIRRTILDEILLRRAASAGARVLEGLKVTDLERSAAGPVEGVRVTDAGGATRSLRAKMIVGADGLRSVVARRLGLMRSGGWPQRIAIATHYRGIEGVGDVGEIHVDRGGYFGMANVGDGMTNVALVVPTSRAGEIAGDRTGFLEDWIHDRPQLAPRFRSAERVTAVRTTGPFASRARKPWVPGAALVGDAADFFDPFTGEGIYSALRGGELIAPHIADIMRNPATEIACLREYARTRRKVFGDKWRFERMVGRAVSTPWMMDRVGKVLSRRSDLADLMVGVAGDFVPAKEVLNIQFLLRFALAREQWA